jgi:hypothetical protein
MDDNVYLYDSLHGDGQRSDEEEYSASVSEAGDGKSQAEVNTRTRVVSSAATPVSSADSFNASMARLPPFEQLVSATQAYLDTVQGNSASQDIV